MPRASVICISHGGGPLPVIGGPGHKDIIYSLTTRVPKILKLGTPEAPRAIVCVTAHWSERQPTISSASRHDLYYDYGGLPREAYDLEYAAPGSPVIANDVKNALISEGFTPILNGQRGWDHGVFIPLMLINPTADIPIIQLSVLLSEDPAQHLRMGRAISKLRDSNIAILGSGFASIHDNRKVVPLMLTDTKVPELLAQHVCEWNVALADAVTKERRKDREEILQGWRDFAHSYEMHPRGAADHFMPLLVCAGAAGDEVAKTYKDDFLGMDIWTYYWVCRLRYTNSDLSPQGIPAPPGFRCPPRDLVAWLLDQAEDCEINLHGEPSWNTELHLSTMEWALRPNRHRGLVDYTYCTGAQVVKTYRAKQSASNMVDFCMVIRPPGGSAEASRIDEVRENRPDVTINHTDHGILCKSPIVVSFETKRPGADLEKAMVQMGSWHSSQWRSFLQGSTDPRAVQFLPGVIIIGHSWSFVASAIQDGKSILYSDVELGKTSTELGIITVLLAMQHLARWAENTYWPVFKSEILQM